MLAHVYPGASVYPGYESVSCNWAYSGCVCELMIKLWPVLKHSYCQGNCLVAGLLNFSFLLPCPPLPLETLCPLHTLAICLVILDANLGGLRVSVPFRFGHRLQSFPRCHGLKADVSVDCCRYLELFSDRCCSRSAFQCLLKIVLGASSSM